MASSPLYMSDADDEEVQDFQNQFLPLNNETDTLDLIEATVDAETGEKTVAPQVSPFEPAIVLGNMGTAKETYLWGSEFNLQDVTNRVFNFFLDFMKDEQTKTGHYITMLEQAAETETDFININCEHISQHDPKLYQSLISFPAEVIPVFDLTVMGLLRERGLKDEVQVRPYGLKQIASMRDLNPSDIETLVSIQGMVIRSSAIVPDLREALFKCLMCQNTQSVLLERNILNEPTTCNNCKARHSFEIIHNGCSFADKQFIKLQETVESIPEGETPQTTTLVVFDSLVDIAKPGDKVLVTGIYKAAPVRQSTSRRTTQSVFRTYIDVVHFQKTQTGRVGSVHEDETEEGDTLLTAEKQKKIQQILKLSKEPNIYKKLVMSFAPSIWELDEVKRGVLCQLFGGTAKTFAEKGTGHFRGEINILLCGDPGTSKSQMLQYVHKMAPRGLYTSGKGSSAVGLTAFVTKDMDTGETVLESGALVLSDSGVCCIDEFDKMSDMTRSVLHEAMEQQTVSVAKSGIVCSLNARTSILASANPRESKYNPTLSVVDNIQLPPTLLSRFDLIYLILDKPDPQTDRRLAKHLVSLYFKNPDSAEEGIIPISLLTEFIAYAKKHCHPVLSDAAADKLIEGYVQMRQMGPNSVAGKRTISATPRQLESIIRIAEALAKMELSNVVTEKHVTEGIRLMKVAIQEAATDPRTGQIDMDLISTGRSASTRQSLANMQSALAGLLETLPQTTKANELFRLLQEQSSVTVQRESFEEVLKAMEEEGLITTSGNLKNRTILKLNQ